MFPPVDIFLISRHFLKVDYSLTLKISPGYGAKKRRHCRALFSHFSLTFFTFFSLFLVFHFLSLIMTLFLKGRWDQPSLRVDVWYIPWWRMYLITIFAEHCVKIHDSWYFQGILDHVKNIDIDIKVSLTFLNESVDKRDILITYLYPCSERINVIKTSLERDISLTNLYPFQERIMVIETSL